MKAIGWFGSLAVCAGIAPLAVAAQACLPMQKQPYAVFTFLGFECADAWCAAHKSGFAWADRSRITDKRACIDVGDLAFREGCHVFAANTVTAEQSGFEWARENEVTDPCFCRGAGRRFQAGCEAYVTIGD